jgi:hypothetical protein
VNPLLRFWLLPGCAVLLLAADPSWKNKPIPSWTAAEARQILTDSPWAKTATAGLARIQSEDQRREGGDMGQPHGVGVDGLIDKNIKQTPIDIMQHGRIQGPPSVPLRVRWETALPIQAAELKAGELDPPTLEGEGYKVAVYGIPTTTVKGDPKKLGEPLKSLAALKRDGKPDVRPISVEVFQRQDGFVVVYLFPLSAEIGKKDAIVEFDAQIGRLIIRQPFDVSQMYFQGRLEM